MRNLVRWVGAVALTGCTPLGTDTLMRRAETGCVINHPADQPDYRTARAECVENAGHRILAPAISHKDAMAWQQVWENDVLLAQQVDAGKITPEQAKALSAGLRSEMLGHGD